jgi:hypothetical protein
MTFSRQIIVVGAAAAALGGAAGFALGPGSPVSSPTPGRTRTSSPAPRHAPPTGSTAGSANAEANDAFVEAVRTSSGARRWLLLLGAAEKSSAADMPRLIFAARGDSAALRMLAARWAELDPQHMFDTLAAATTDGGLLEAFSNRWELSDVLFAEWIKKDVEAAIAALDDRSRFPQAEGLRMNVANQIIKADVERGLRLMKEWNVRHYIPDMKAVGEWAKSDPRHAAEMVRQFGLDYAGQEALKQVGQVWGKSDPRAALEYASSLSGEQSKSFVAAAIKEWASQDLRAAIDFAAGQVDPHLRSQLGRSLVETWAKTDPQSALAWSQENLKGEAREEAIGGVVQTVAANDLNAAAELVSSLDPGGSKNRAAGALLERWFEKGDKEAAIEWMAALPDADTRKGALEKVQWNWLWKDPEGVRAFVSGPHGHLAPPSMISQLASQEARKSPEAAMQWVNKLPAEQAEQARDNVISTWLQIRPEGATRWALGLPPGDDRTGAMRRIASQIAFYSEPAAINFLSALPAVDRAVARDAIGNAHLDEARKARLLESLAR